MPKRIVLINAYSAANKGDGLLVDLTAQLLAEAGADRAGLSVIAADPDSFPAGDVVAPFAGQSRKTKGIHGMLALLGGSAVGRGMSRDALERVLGADAIFSVGGGYLRGETVHALRASMLVHFAQMRVAADQAQHGVPWVVMPQSIGPYAPAVWRSVRSVLRHARDIYVRDDKSLRQLQLPQAHRVPDLAVLEIADTYPKIEPVDSTTLPPAFVIRHIEPVDTYAQKLRLLCRHFPDAYFGVQSTVGGNNDTPFIEKIAHNANITDYRALLTDRKVGAAVAVRLHGALQSILAGVPVIHLSYERKGFAAFHDLGLGEYVHDARTFEPDVVRRQLTALQNNPGQYWDRIETHLDTITTQRADIVRRLSHALQAADTVRV